jgi:transcriptional regulator of met regulon
MGGGLYHKEYKMNKSFLVVIGLGVVIAIALLTLRREMDPTLVMTLTAGFVMQILNFISSRENSEKIKETRHAMNSLLDKQVENAQEIGRGEGLREGRDLANARTDELTRQAQDGRNE